LKIYIIQEWRKKLRLALGILAFILFAVAVLSLWGGAAKQTITDPPDTRQLQQDVLTQPLRVQALPDAGQGEILS
jgi:hypothetical protein